MSTHARINLTEPPYPERPAAAPWAAASSWPARWITLSEAAPPPFVAAYRLQLSLAQPLHTRVHVTADERYDLFIDGQRIGRGPERGDVSNWFYESYELQLTAGDHCLVARVWSLGPEHSPVAQLSAHHGFLFSPDSPAAVPLLASGVAPWQVKRLSGLSFCSPLAAWGTGSRVVVDGKQFPWGFETGAGDSWEDAPALFPANDSLARSFRCNIPVLRPAMLPPMLDVPRALGRVRHVADTLQPETSGIAIRAKDHLAAEAPQWSDLLRHRKPLRLGPHAHRRVLIDLENYYCAFTEVVTSGGSGASVRVHWQESLFEDEHAQHKGNRDSIEGKYFTTIWHGQDGIGNTFLPDGGAHRRFEGVWWESGRYLELVVLTQDEPLVIESLQLRETRYPLEAENRFACSDARLAATMPVMVRALQMCSHETYMDCPYYEQLMYQGDARIESLITYAISRDDRLPRKALEAFAWSRLPDGLTQSRYPSNVRQVIPPFSLLWIEALHDFALWRGDLGFVRRQMPVVRGVLERFRDYVDQDHLLRSPPGWNYVDWVPSWPHGVPPGADDGKSAILNFQLLGALQKAAELERWLDEPALASRIQAATTQLGEAIQRAFWSPEKRLFADDLGHSRFSEHAQSLAILTFGGASGPARTVGRTLLSASECDRTTIYFSHYTIEALRLLGQSPLPLLGRWFGLPNQGFKTTREAPEPSRSDCHAWSAHPLFHFHATVLGVRPAAPGFARAQIQPLLDGLDWAEGTLPHPHGEITVRFERRGGGITGFVRLPGTVAGHLDLGTTQLPLGPGETRF